jgi:hypothetical protein
MQRYKPGAVYETTSDIVFPANYEGQGDPLWTLPAGSEVIQPRDRPGHFAVKDTALLIRLTGNQHDPIWKYYWVPAAAVRLRG